MAGRRIFLKRLELRAFSLRNRYVVDTENPFAGFKTTEVHITRELAPVCAKISADLHSNQDGAEIDAITRGYDQYTVTINSNPLPRSLSRPALSSNPSGEALLHRQHKVALEANTAAWGYTKIALLFFISLLVTWVSPELSRPRGSGTGWFLQSQLCHQNHHANERPPRLAGPVVRQPRLFSHISGSPLGALHLRFERRASSDGFLELAHLHYHLMEGLQAPLSKHEGLHRPPGPAGTMPGKGPAVNHEHEPVSVGGPCTEERTQQQWQRQHENTRKRVRDGMSLKMVLLRESVHKPGLL